MKRKGNIIFFEEYVRKKREKKIYNLIRCTEIIFLIVVIVTFIGLVFFKNFDFILGLDVLIALDIFNKVLKELLE